MHYGRVGPGPGLRGGGGGDTGESGEPSSQDGADFSQTATSDGDDASQGGATPTPDGGQGVVDSSSDSGQGADGELLEEDRAVLEAFYHATGGDNWLENDNWLSSLVPISLWHGVETNAEGRVVSISLSSNNLVGEVPRALENLPALTTLDLGFNHLEGVLSTEVQERIEMEESDLSGVTLACPGLPHPSDRPASAPLLTETSAETDREALLAIFEATNGEEWDQSGTWATARSLDNWGGVTLDENGRVVRLIFGYSTADRMTGVLPAELGNLQELRRLEIGGSGPIPPELGSLQNLWELGLRGQFCEAIPPELGNLENLVKLEIAETPLSGRLPPEIGNLRKMERLVINRNRLSGELPPELANLQDVENVFLDGNRFGGEIPEELEDWLYWRSVNIGANGGGSSFSGCVADFTEIGLTIQTMEFYSNNNPDVPLLPACEGIDPEDEASLVALYQAMGEPAELGDWLQRDVPAWEWTGVGTDREGRVVSLYLDIETGDLPPEIGAFPNLRYLYVGSRLPTEAFNLQNLESLTIRIPSEFNQEESDAWRQFLPQLARMQSLKSLYIRAMSLHAMEIPPGLGSLENLERLSIIGLTGEIPPELGNLQNLEYLEFGFDRRGKGFIGQTPQIIGTLPPELGNLRNLKRLVLREGRLTGTIPAEFGNLVNLERLHIYAAHPLDGPLPVELSNLVNVNLLNLYSMPNLAGDEEELSPEICGWLKGVARLSLHPAAHNGGRPVQCP